MAQESTTMAAAGVPVTTEQADGDGTPITYQNPVACNTDNSAIYELVDMFVQKVQIDKYINGTTPAATVSPRAAFVKIHGSAYGHFAVHSDIPKQYQVGLFQPGATYRAWVRYSSDVVASKPDFSGTAGNTAGIGIKLFDIVGEKVLPDTVGSSTVDFVLQNTTSFFAPNAQKMCQFKHASLGGYLDLWRKDNPVTDRILNEMTKPVNSLLEETLWSCIPFLFGADTNPNSQLYCKYKLMPLAEPNAPAPTAGSDPNYLSIDLETRLRAGSVEFQFMLQPRTSMLMSIDDATDVWDETADGSPPIAVATLTLFQQDITAPGQRDYGESLAYHIWRTLAAHPPVGTIAEVRKAVYQSSAQIRRHYNGQSLGEPVTPRPSPENMLKVNYEGYQPMVDDD